MSNTLLEAIKDLNDDRKYNVWVGEIVDYDFSDLESGWAEVSIGRDSDDEYLLFHFEVSCALDQVEVIWEPDGEPTYVDYGSQSVLYDDGKGGIESIVARDAVDVELISIVNNEDKQYTKEEALQFLKCTRNDLDDAINTAYSAVLDDYILYIESNYEPEYPEYEPDYYDEYRDNI
jgi:hypothetical protein